MDNETIPGPAAASGAEDEGLSGLADHREEGRDSRGSALVVVPGVAGEDERLRGLRLGQGCPGGYCEMCPVAVQMECERGNL